MRKKKPGEDAIAALTEIGDELTQLIGQLREHQNVAMFYEQLDRWRDRADSTLERRVSAVEARKLRDIPPRPLFLFYPPDEVIAAYSRFLAALNEEAVHHPDNFRSPAGEKMHRRSSAPWPSLQRPERITPAWIWRNADAKWAIGALLVLLSALYGAFVFGVHASRNAEVLRVLAPFLLDSSLTQENSSAAAHLVGPRRP